MWQRSYKHLDDAALLQRLWSGEAPVVERAWQELLRRYARLFLKIIWQFERDVDAAMAQYVYVCTRLAEDDFARLRKYQPEGRANPPKLSTWLTVVVKNLCLEQRRVVHGRRRWPRALEAMSDFDRKVFELYYWKGYTPEEIALTLEIESQHDGASVAGALARLEALALRPSRTWHSERDPAFVPFDELYHRPDDESEGAEETARYETLLARLPAEERLVLRLRFWEDMTASEIAQVLQWESPRRVYTVIERALKTLRTLAKAAEPYPRK
jgi:DNA-directed RNA polymerase specialized sigma24 family protein